MARNNTNKVLVGGVIIGILLLGLIAFGVMQTQIGTSPDAARETCSIDTILTLTAIDALNGSTTVAPTLVARSGGQFIGTITSGSTTLTPGESYEILASNAAYLNTVITIPSLKCGQNLKAIDWYYSAGGSMTVWNSDGVKVTDDAAGGATNQSSITSSATLNMRIEGVTDQSLGDLVVVVEATNTTEVNTITLSGFSGITKTTVPKFYSVNAAGSIAEAYLIPASNFIDGASATGSLYLSAESGQTIGSGDGTAVYVTAYKSQYFRDTDNTFKMGVENSNGVAQYLGTFDYDFLIK